jgi:uncharacterized membrane protein
MKAPERSWLLHQLDEWEAEGLVQPEAARVLRDRFNVNAVASAGLGGLMMGIVGALLVGSGVIVLISHNWDEFSLAQRLACAFVPLLLSQLWTAWLIARAVRHGWKIESAGLLQTLTTGACIALVSQIYHIGGEWTEFLLSWCLLTLPLVWALRARFVAVFYILGIGVWALGHSRAAEIWHQTPWIYPLLLLGIWPYCPGFNFERLPDLFLRRALTLSVMAGIAACSSQACMNASYRNVLSEPSLAWEAAGLWMTFLGAACLSLFPLNKQSVSEGLNTKPHVLLPAVVLLGYAFSATFMEMSETFTAAAAKGLTTTWGRVLMGLFLGLATVAARQRRFGLLSLAMIPLVPLAASLAPSSLSVLSSLHLTAVGLTLIILDFFGKAAAPRSGAAILTALIFLRMIDSKFSLVTKGLVFVGTGIAFLVFNQFMSRRKQARTGAP